MEAQHEAREAHHGAMEAYPGAVEAHPMKVNPFRPTRYYYRKVNKDYISLSIIALKIIFTF
jgi:hypothetical protein